MGHERSGGGGGDDCIDEFVAVLDAYDEAIRRARELVPFLRRLPADQGCVVAGDLAERLSHIGDLAVGKW